MAEKDKRITQIIIGPQSSSRTFNPTGHTLPKSSKIPRLKKSLPQPKVSVSGDDTSTVGILFPTYPNDPWKKYTEIMKILHFEGEVSLVISKKSPRTIVCIREFPAKKTQETIFSYEQLHHINIASVIEAFSTTKLLYIVFERTHFSLEQMIQCPLYPTKEQLAATVGQILDGLCYLSSKKLAHGRLSCSNIHLNLEGVIKLATEEGFCELSEAHQIKDISAIKSITLRLMQKNKEKGITTERYGSHHDVIDFVAAASESTVEKLRKHPLFATNCHGNSWPEMILELVEATNVAVQKHYQLMG